MTAPRVLHPCCGLRMMWSNRRDSRAVFGDCREETVRVSDRSHGKSNGSCSIRIEPDASMDFHALPYRLRKGGRELPSYGTPADGSGTGIHARTASGRLHVIYRRDASRAAPQVEDAFLVCAPASPHAFPRTRQEPDSLKPKTTTASGSTALTVLRRAADRDRERTGGNGAYFEQIFAETKCRKMANAQPALFRAQRACRNAGPRPRAPAADNVKRSRVRMSGIVFDERWIVTVACERSFEGIGFMAYRRQKTYFLSVSGVSPCHLSCLRHCRLLPQMFRTN